MSDFFLASGRQRWSTIALLENNVNSGHGDCPASARRPTSTPDQENPMKQTPTSLKRANASSFPRRFRPKVELLESRLQPGETFGFGFLGGALASTALDLFSLPLEAVASEQTLARVDRPIMRAPDAGGGTIPLSPGE